MTCMDGILHGERVIEFGKVKWCSLGRRALARLEAGWGPNPTCNQNRLSIYVNSLSLDSQSGQSMGLRWRGEERIKKIREITVSSRAGGDRRNQTFLIMMATVVVVSSGSGSTYDRISRVRLCPFFSFFSFRERHPLPYEVTSGKP